MSLGILDNGWTTLPVGPTAVMLTTKWQRVKVAGTMTGGVAVGVDPPLSQYWKCCRFSYRW